jgi:hypothetical protein
LPFPFSVAENNGSCRFPLVPFRNSGNVETWTKRHGDMETWTWRHQTENGNGSPGDFPKSIYHLRNVQTVVCHLSIFVDEETNGSYPSADRLNGRAHLCNLGYHPLANNRNSSGNVYLVGVGESGWGHLEHYQQRIIMYKQGNQVVIIVKATFLLNFCRQSARQLQSHSYRGLIAFDILFPQCYYISFS